MASVLPAPKFKLKPSRAMPCSAVSATRLSISTVSSACLAWHKTATSSAQVGVAEAADSSAEAGPAISPNGKPALIDYVLLPRDWKPNTRTCPTPRLGDFHEGVDHFPVLVRLHASLSLIRAPATPRFDSTRFDSPAAQSVVRDAFGSLPLTPPHTFPLSTATCLRSSNVTCRPRRDERVTPLCPLIPLTSSTYVGIPVLFSGGCNDVQVWLLSLLSFVRGVASPRDTQTLQFSSVSFRVAYSSKRAGLSSITGPARLPPMQFSRTRHPL